LVYLDPQENLEPQVKQERSVHLDSRELEVEGDRKDIEERWVTLV